MIEHDIKKQQFSIGSGADQAYMRYKIFDKNNKEVENEAEARSIDFYTTFVPESLRGKGVAADLVNAGFEWAESYSWHVKASCWYAEKLWQRRQR